MMAVGFLLAGCETRALQTSVPVAVQHKPAPCLNGVFELPLLGASGDSPLVPVTIDGRPAAMFFSPGYAPILLRDNGLIQFKGENFSQLHTQQDDEWVDVHTTAFKLGLGDLDPVDQAGFLLGDAETRSVDGRPIVGMIGRNLLNENAVIDLDIPHRRLVTAILREPRCAQFKSLLDTPYIPMERDILYVPVRINGHRAQAILEPDLPVSVIPDYMADGLGISRATVAHGPSVRTMFNRRVRGHRVKVASLQLGVTRLTNLDFDVEHDIDDVILGLNVFARGEAVFDLGRDSFYFQASVEDPPPPGALHFDETKVAHVTATQ